MKIAVRMDDIAPGMDWKKFADFKALLDEYGIKPLIGVVPDNQDRNLERTEENGKDRHEHMPEDFWEYVKGLQEQGWIVAMHGYRHVYTQKKGGVFPLNLFSNLRGCLWQSSLLCWKRKERPGFPWNKDGYLYGSGPFL